MSSDATLSTPDDPGMDPVTLFLAQREHALAAAEKWDAASTCLATTGPDGPDARFVLVKEVELAPAPGVFFFFTNYTSDKAKQIEAEPRVALAFHWDSIKVQFRIRGVASKTTEARNDAYFQTRPRISQLGAWASAQSSELDSRATLLARLHDAEVRFPGEVTRPPHWGGYGIVPREIEFWREGAYRLHERFLYTWNGDTRTWRRRLLNP